MHVEEFNFASDDHQIRGILYVMSDSCLIWLSLCDELPEFHNLSVTFPSHLGPISSEIYGTSDTSSMIGRHISNKLKVPCFVSLELNEDLFHIVPMLQQELFDRLSCHFNQTDLISV